MSRFAAGWVVAALSAGCAYTANDEAREAWELVDRLNAPEARWLLDGISYSLIHVHLESSKTDVDDLQETLRAVDHYREGRIDQLRNEGGARGFLDQLRRRLDHPDPALRSFAMLALGLAGDRESAPRFARLIEEETAKAAATPAPNDSEEDSPSFISPAAMALGLLGAREYEPLLAALLSSPYPGVRAAGAWGLGFMEASGRSEEVAKLLEDSEDDLHGVAIQALARLGARRYAEAIAKRMGEFPPTETIKYAFALVRLEAKDQAPAIARFLEEGNEAATAARALALLGAKEYAGRIARLLESKDHYEREAGAIALGILGDRERAPAIRTLLKDPDAEVRREAAIALLLLLAAGDSAEDLVAALGRRPPHLDRHEYDPLVVARVAEINGRADRELRKLEPERK